MSTHHQSFALKGGLNLVNSPLETSPGQLLDCLNYDALPLGGYRRTYGYKKLGDVLPGSGPCRGVHVYKGDVYGFRDDVSQGRLYKLVAGSWQAVTLPAALPLEGAYNCFNHNFFGQDAKEAMFGTSGKGKAFTLDQAGFRFITTGIANEMPACIGAMAKHLMLGIGSSLMISSIGNPEEYDSNTGAAEIALGDTVTDIGRLPGESMLLGCQDSNHILYGNSAANWQAKFHNDSGTLPRTIQFVGGHPLSMDVDGVKTMAASQAYGDFDYNAVSMMVKPYLDRAISRGPAVSSKSKRHNQYRVWFGRDGLRFTFAGNQLAGITKTKFPVSVSCASTGDDQNGAEISLIGGEDGCVYQLDETTKFDGEDVYAFMLLAFNSVGSPSRRKRFRSALLDMLVEGTDRTTQLIVKPLYDFGNDELQTAYAELQALRGGGGLWDFAEWDNFYWDSPYLSDGQARFSGVGRNMALAISSTGATDNIHSIHSVTLHYSPRKLTR